MHQLDNLTPTENQGTNLDDAKPTRFARVLVISGEPDGLAAHLEQEDMEVLLASHEQASLQRALGQLRPDCVLLDLADSETIGLAAWLTTAFGIALVRAVDLKRGDNPRALAGSATLVAAPFTATSLRSAVERAMRLRPNGKDYLPQPTGFERPSQLLKLAAITTVEVPKYSAYA